MIMKFKKILGNLARLGNLANSVVCLPYANKKLPNLLFDLHSHYLNWLEIEGVKTFKFAT